MPGDGFDPDEVVDNPPGVTVTTRCLITSTAFFSILSIC
jgi:hypothetical protein